MAFLDRFEKRIENLVNSAFAKTFHGQVKPVELASALRRELDDRAAVVARDRTLAPNDLTVRLAEEDYNNIEQWGAEALAGELADEVAQHAHSQRYVLVGPVTVTFEKDPELETGRFLVTSEIVRGAIAPATTPMAKHPVLDVNGQRYVLTGPVTVIGRGSEADIIVADSGISRQHLRIRVTPEGTIAEDMGSTNGTFVENQRMQAVTLVDGNTITIGRTTIMYWEGEDDSEDGTA